MRDYCSEDYPEVESLWKTTGLLVRSDNKGLYERKILEYPGLFVVAENNGIVVGAVYGFNPYFPFSSLGMGYVGHLAVDPSQQGMGLGSMLLDEICSRITERGNKYVILFADSRGEKGKALHRFYSQRHRFKRFLGVFYKKLD